MVRKALVVLGLLALVALGGAFMARGRGMVVPGLAAQPLTGLIDRPLASGDSLILADFARDRCRLVPTNKRQPCYEEILLATVEKGQVRLAMDALSVLARLDRSTVRRGHDYAHVVGINAWTPEKEVGPVYDSCTGLYQSGCYHGVVQAFLDARGTDSATVYQLCNSIKSAVYNMWLRFQCVHGVGHGLVNNFSLNLPRALKGCDWLVDPWDAQSCYGGAFMEFIVAGRGQSHHPHKKESPAPSTAAAGHDGHSPPAAPGPAPGEHAAAGHDPASHEHETADSFPIRDKTGLLYPCTVLDTKYQTACYMMQAGIVIELVGRDFGKIAHACDDAPVSMQPACYQGVGTYVSGYVVRDPVKAIDLCSKGDAKLQAWCYVGVVKNFIDVTANPDDGFSFCRRLTDHAYAVACFNGVGEEMSVLFPAAEEREKQCAKASRDYIEVCRYGANLPAPRPKDLLPFSPTS